MLHLYFRFNRDLLKRGEKGQRGEKRERKEGEKGQPLKSKSSRLEPTTTCELAQLTHSPSPKYFATDIITLH